MDFHSPVIVWFRRDLRLADNPALDAAIQSGRTVLPIFIFDDSSTSVTRALGGASRWWLHNSLKQLSSAIEKRKGNLILRRGAAEKALRNIIDESGASAVYLNHSFIQDEFNRDEILQQSFKNVSFKFFDGTVLVNPRNLTTQQEKPFRVFTPFWKSLQNIYSPIFLSPAPNRFFSTPNIYSDSLSQWNLLPTKPDWSGGLQANWLPGETAALRSLDGFIQTVLNDYPESRNRPDLIGTSKISPYLCWGEISPHRIWKTVMSAVDANELNYQAAISLLRQLAWRDFNYHLLFHFPQMQVKNWRPEFDRFPWQENSDLLAAWCSGRTGYPLVDAAMRELWITGWMHNRVRMVVASFLVKHLLVHWRLGEAWFWDTLIDADFANNIANWQWVTGCGADAAPYFRIFNPILQAAKFDPEGAYIRYWLPELAKLPNRWLHCPWEASAEDLSSAGVKLGKSYPYPLVEHNLARKRALAAYQTIQKP